MASYCFMRREMYCSVDNIELLFYYISNEFS